jgi:hypothetical protein
LAANKCWQAQARFATPICAEDDNKRTVPLFMDSPSVPLVLAESSIIFYWTYHTCLLFFPILMSYIIIVSVLLCVICKIVTFWDVTSCSLVDGLERRSASILRLIDWSTDCN